MSDVGDIKENFEDENKVNIEATSVNLECVKNEPIEGALYFEENCYATQYRIALGYENIFGESSHRQKIEEDSDNLIGFLGNDVIIESAMIKLEAIKEEDEGTIINFRCTKCKEIYKGYCLKCSTLLQILNNNSAFVSTESNTIPTDILEIRETFNRKGVYSLRTLPINILFGPFEGIVGIETTVGHGWKITDNKLKNIKSGNWMKNIVCASSALLKNLDIFQIHGNLYFQTNREITEGEELLIYYQDEELQYLDNSEECLYTPQKQEKLPKIFACTLCCVGFGSTNCLMEHKRKCCRMEHSRNTKDFILIECHYCKIWMEKWEHAKYHVAYCLEKHTRMCRGYSEAVHRSDTDVEEMEGDCDTKDDKRRYRRDICSRPCDRRDDLQSDAKDYQCFSGTNRETRVNECALLERSNNEQIKIKVETNRESHFHLNKHKSFTCDICMMKFTQKSSLNIHIKNKHTDDDSMKDYKCLECTFQTKYKANIERHLNQHRGIKPYKCDLCTVKVSQKSDLARHIKNKHKDGGGVKDYKCLECSYQTNSKWYLQDHLNMHRGIKPFTCDICTAKFTQKISLKMHIKNKHRDDVGVKDYKCSDCTYQTNSKSHLNIHLNTHEGIKPFECDICMAKFTQNGSLKAHIRDKHTDDGNVKDYKCSECTYQTNHKSHLKKHLNKHTDIKPFTCDICMKNFGQKGELKRHIRNKHANDGTVKDYECTECFYQTDYKYDLKKHLDKHRGVTFTCDICMVKYTDKSSLNAHIKSKHTDNGSRKDYKCLECSYQTNNKTSFQKHVNKHIDIKPFRCDICMIEFTLKSSLQTHIKKKHTDDGSAKDYKCAECSYETNYKGNFQTHLNVHNGIKPFTCDICIMKFTTKGNLKTHMENKHTDNESAKHYKCTECSYQTNYKSDLKKHLYMHRGIKPFTCDICMTKFTRKASLTKHIKNKHTSGGSAKDYKQ